MNTPQAQNGSKSLAGRILVIAGLLVVAVFGFRTISNADFWTHLATGRWIAGHGIPRVDTLSYTAQGQPWINVSWLYDRALFTLWSLGGAVGVTVVHVLAVLAAFALLLPVVKEWAGGSSKALALALCAWILAPRFVIGPNLIALLFAAVFLFVLSRSRSLTTTFVVLLPIQVLWANMHASFLLGPAICAAFVAEDVLRRKGSGPESAEPAGSNGSGLLILTGLALLLTLVNPYHIRVYRQVLGAFGIFSVMEAREWISPFSSQFNISIAARHVVTLALLVGAGGLVTERRRLPFAMTALAVAGAFFVVFSLWYADFFAVLAFPFIALSIHALGESVRTVSRKLLNAEAPALPVAGGVLAAAVVLLSLGTVTTNAFYVASGSASSFGCGVESDLFPSAAASVLERAGFPDRAFNLPSDGGFLLWKTPARQIFIDNRPGVYGADTFNLGGRCLAGVDEAWEELEEKWSVRAAVFNCTVPGATHTIRTLLLGRRWRLVYFDGTSVVLVRSSVVPEDLAKDAELQQSGLRLLEAERARYVQRLAKGCRPPNSPRLIGAANLYLALERYNELRVVSELLTLGSPKMTSAWQQLGLAELQLGHLDAAEQALDKAAQLMPKNVWPWLHLSQVYLLRGDKAGERMMLDRARRLSVPVTEAFLAERGKAGASSP